MVMDGHRWSPYHDTGQFGAAGKDMGHVGLAELLALHAAVRPNTRGRGHLLRHLVKELGNPGGWIGYNGMVVVVVGLGWR